MWKTIPNYDDYKISIEGLVMNKHKKILKTRLSSGYNRVRLYNTQGSKNILVHRIVMLSFVGKSDLEVNHIHGNKLDNRLSNLEYVSRSENQKHRYYVLKKGIKSVVINGIKYNSFVEASEKLKVSKSFISALYRRVKTSNKYKISYD